MKIIFLDIEAKIPDIKTVINFFREDTFAVGVAIKELGKEVTYTPFWDTKKQSFVPDLPQIIKKISAQIDGAIVVGHNIKFDARGLMALGVNFENVYLLDTLMLCTALYSTRDHLRGRTNYRLESIGKDYGIAPKKELELIKGLESVRAEVVEATENGTAYSPREKAYITILPNNILRKKKLDYNDEASLKNDTVVKTTKKAMHIIPEDIVGEYCMHDVVLTEHIFLHMLEDLSLSVEQISEAISTDKYYGNLDRSSSILHTLRVLHLESRVLKILLYSENFGVPVDISHIRKTHAIVAEELSYARKELAKEGIYKLNSRKDLIAYADRKGISYPTKIDEKGEIVAGSLDKNWQLATGDPVLASVQELRKYSKIGSTLETIGDRAVTEGASTIHPSFYINKSDTGGTVTGRMSSSAPSVQTLNKESRKAFYKKNHIVCSIDFGQIEYAITIHYLSHYTKDKTLLESWRNKEDIHTVMAHKIFKKELEKLEKDSPEYADTCKLYRNKAKASVFAMIFGGGAARLSEILGVSTEETFSTKKAFLKSLSGYWELISALNEQISANGCFYTWYGHKCTYYTWTCGKKNKENKDIIYPDKATALREAGIGNSYKVQRAKTHSAINHLIQGTAADALKIAIVEISKSDIVRKTGLPRLFIHDEIVFFIPTEHATFENLEALSTIMCSAGEILQLRTPLKTDIEIGRDFGSLVELTPENLQKVIEEVKM